MSPFRRLLDRIREIARRALLRLSAWSAWAAGGLTFETATGSSSEAFCICWASRRLPLPAAPARTTDIYAAYRHWCGLHGLKPASLKTFATELIRIGAARARPWYFDGEGRRQSWVTAPPGCSIPTGDKPRIARDISAFAEALRSWLAAGRA